MRQHDITDHIKETIIKEPTKRCIIAGLGVFEIVPGRKGKHFNMVTQVWEKSDRKYRIRFKPSPVLKNWIKTLK